MTLDCTGAYKPNTEFMDEECLSASKKIKVNSFLQVDGKPNIFALGSVIDSENIVKVVHILDHSIIVAYNVLSQIKSKPLKEYKYNPFNGMFLALGKTKGLGALPFWLPQGLTDFLAKYLKCSDLMASTNGIKLFQEIKF